MGIPVCLTCTHPQVQEIDALLRAGRSPLSIHDQFGLKYDTVKRHKSKGHVAMAEGVTGNRSRPETGDEDSPVEQMRALIEELQEIDQSKMSITQRATLARELRLSLEALGKMAGPGTTPKINILEHEEWLRLSEMLHRALIPYPDALEAVRKATDEFILGQQNA